MKTTAHVLITPEKVVVGEKILIFGSTGADLLVEIYRQKVGNYPKFFKMDPLARLGFVATELLLGEENPRRTDCEDRPSGKTGSFPALRCSSTLCRTS